MDETKFTQIAKLLHMCCICIICIFCLMGNSLFNIKMNEFTCYSFMQEPFKTLPLIWTIHEKTLAARLRKYTSDGQIELINDWKKTFNRATVVVFPNYVLPVKFISHFYYQNSWLVFFFSFNLKNWIVLTTSKNSTL